MLVDDRVEVTLTSNTIDYYEKLGYNIPRIKDNRGRIKMPRYTKITVNINDLPKSSGTIVNVKCDICNKIYSLSYNKYNLQLERHNGFIRCIDCYNKNKNGINNPNYNPNLSDEERLNGRYNKKYRDWCQKVLINYNYQCVRCGNKHNLNSHHLYNWKDNEQLRYEISNGISLCEECHKNFHFLYGYRNNTKEQFEEWINKDIDYKINDSFKILTARPIIRLEDKFIIESVSGYYKKSKTKCDSEIRRVCNGEREEYKGIHYMYYDEYLKCSKEYIDIKLRSRNRGNRKYVRCVETHIIYNSLKDVANIFFNGNSSSVKKYIDKNIDYNGLHFEYINVNNLNELYEIARKEDIIGKEIN